MRLIANICLQRDRHRIPATQVRRKFTETYPGSRTDRRFPHTRTVTPNRERRWGTRMQSCPVVLAIFSFFFFQFFRFVSNMYIVSVYGHNHCADVLAHESCASTAFFGGEWNDLIDRRSSPTRRAQKTIVPRTSESARAQHSVVGRTALSSFPHR